MRTDTSHYVDLDGPTHYVDFGGPKDATPLVLVHGLGGSHTNWTAVGPALAEHHRVYALDLAGHGLTRPDHRATDVHSNQHLLDRFIREVAGGPVTLMGNSMGGMVSILQSARNPDTVSALALVDPAIPAPLGFRHHDKQVLLSFATYTIPGVGGAVMSRMRRRTTPEQQMRRLLDLCCVDPSRIPAESIDRGVAVVAQRRTFPGIDQAFLDAARSVVAMQTSGRRYRALMHAVRAPVLLLQGERDRLVPVQAAYLAAQHHPEWHVEIAPDIGHVPQLEAPHWTVARYLHWREQLDSPATRAGTPARAGSVTAPSTATGASAAAQQVRGG